MFSRFIQYFKSKDSMFWFWVFAIFVIIAWSSIDDLKILLFIFAPIILCTSILMYSFSNLWSSIYYWLRYRKNTFELKVILFIIIFTTIALVVLYYIENAKVCIVSQDGSENCGHLPRKLIGVVKSIIPISLFISVVISLMKINTSRIEKSISQIEKTIDEHKDK